MNLILGFRINAFETEVFELQDNQITRKDVMKKVFGIVLGCALIFSSASVVMADAAANFSKCVACHGSNGHSTNPAYPRLAGQHAKYLEKQMNDIATGKRKNNPMLAAMIPAVKSLSSDQKHELAEWLSKQ